MHAPNPNFLKKLKIPSLFRPRASLAKKNRFRMEPAGLGKKNRFRTEPASLGKKPVGSVWNRSEAVQGAGLNRSGLGTGRTGWFYRFRFGSGNTELIFYVKVHMGSQWRGSWQLLSDPLVYTSHFHLFQ
jgi:hypothetical protein